MNCILIGSLESGLFKGLHSGGYTSIMYGNWNVEARYRFILNGQTTKICSASRVEISKLTNSPLSVLTLQLNWRNGCDFMAMDFIQNWWDKMQKLPQDNYSAHILILRLHYTFMLTMLLFVFFPKDSTWSMQYTRHKMWFVHLVTDSKLYCFIIEPAQILNSVNKICHSVWNSYHCDEMISPHMVCIPVIRWQRFDWHMLGKHR